MPLHKIEVNTKIKCTYIILHIFVRKERVISLKVLCHGDQKYRHGTEDENGQNSTCIRKVWS